ncbi:MAG: TIGR02147 family protein [Bdellovibrio sp.]|nr:TIGR02147 family protein [Bdellovibrio sp.]
MHYRTTFHLEYLGQELKERQRRNPQYSLRSFARDLSVAPSWVSEVLNGKKGMSEQKATQLSESLGLSKKEAKVFVLSAQATHSRRASDRIAAAEKIKTLASNQTTFKKIKSDEFQFISSWYFQTILELTELEGFDHSVQWLSKKLGLPLRVTTNAVQKLVSLGWLKISEGQIKASYNESETEFDKPSSAIKDYHHEILMLAKNALFEQDIQSREFSNMTLAFDSAKVAEAQKFIRAFQKQFSEKFYNPGSKKNSVYQLSMQLFRLDQKDQ